MSLMSLLARPGEHRGAALIYSKYGWNRKRLHVHARHPPGDGCTDRPRTRPDLCCNHRLGRLRHVFGMETKVKARAAPRGSRLHTACRPATHSLQSRFGCSGQLSFSCWESVSSSSGCRSVSVVGQRNSVSSALTVRILPLQSRLHALPLTRIPSFRFLNKVLEVQKEAGWSFWWVCNSPVLAFCLDIWPHGCPRLHEPRSNQIHHHVFRNNFIHG
jgi:hypothetical protein